MMSINRTYGNCGNVVSAGTSSISYAINSTVDSPKNDEPKRI